MPDDGRHLTSLTRYVHYGHRDPEARAANAAHQRLMRARRKARAALTPEEAAEREALLARVAELEREALKRGARRGT